MPKINAFVFLFVYCNYLLMYIVQYKYIRQYEYVQHQIRDYLSAN